MSAFKKVGESKRFSLSKGMLDLAPHVIMSVPCEWEGCQIVLNSWQTLAKVNITIHQSEMGLLPALWTLKNHSNPAASALTWLDPVHELQEYWRFQGDHWIFCSLLVLLWLWLIGVVWSLQHLLQHCSHTTPQEVSVDKLRDISQAFRAFTGWNIPVPSRPLLWSRSSISGQPESACWTQSHVACVITLSHSRYAYCVLTILLYVLISSLGCDEMFVRAPLLGSHIEEVHRKDLGDYVSADAIAPLANPALPFSLPPPLPLSCPRIPQHTTVASVVPSKRRASQALLNGTKPLARRWSKLNVEDEDQDHCITTFDDLPRFQLSKTPDELVPVEVRKRLPRSQTRMSRPQRVIYPPIRTDDVPDTILYGTFSLQVKKFVADSGVVKRY